MANKMNKSLRIVLILLPILAGAGIVAWAYKKQNKKIAFTPPGTKPPVTTTPAGCNFPLKKGSVNDCVRQLQLALMAKYGLSILPQFGADGNWGSETNGAVLSATGQTQINSQADLNIILNNLNNTQGQVGGEVVGESWWFHD